MKGHGFWKNSREKKKKEKEVEDSNSSLHPWSVIKLNINPTQATRAHRHTPNPNHHELCQLLKPINNVTLCNTCKPPNSEVFGAVHRCRSLLGASPPKLIQIGTGYISLYSSSKYPWFDLLACTCGLTTIHVCFRVHDVFR